MELCALPAVDACDACEGDRNLATNNATTIHELDAEIMASVVAILGPFDGRKREVFATLLANLVDLAIRAGHVHGALKRCVSRIERHHGLDEVQPPV